jgi:hypothetical protein
MSLPKAEVTIAKSQQKVMLIACFDNLHVIHREFVPVEQAMSFTFCIDILKCLRNVIQWERPEKWRDSWMLD